MVRNTSKPRVQSSAGLQKTIEKKKRMEKKQNRFFRLYVDGHPLDATQKAHSKPMEKESQVSSESLWTLGPLITPLKHSNNSTAPSETVSSLDNTMRGVTSLPMVVTEKKASEETLSQKSTDNLLAGLFSPSDYQKNLDSPATPVSSESLWTLGPLITPAESVNPVTPSGLFCSCKTWSFTSEASLPMVSHDEEELHPLIEAKDSLELVHTHRLVHFEEETLSSSDEEKKESSRKRLTKKRQRKGLSDTDRITALEMELHFLKEMILGQSKATTMEKATETEEKAVEDLINSVSENKSSVRQRVALFEAKSDTAVNVKKGEETSKRQTHTA